MFSVKCPHCSSRFHRFWLSEDQQCSQCQTHMDLANTFTLGILFAAAGLAITVAFHFLTPGQGWWRVPAAFAAWAVMIPVVVRLFARWRVLPDGFDSSPQLHFWGRAITVAVLVGCIAVVGSIANLAYQFQIIMAGTGVADTSAFYYQRVVVPSGGGLLLGVLCLATASGMAAKKKRLIKEQRFTRHSSHDFRLP